MKRRLLVGKVIGNEGLRVREVVKADGTKEITQLKESRRKKVTDVHNNDTEEVLSLEERAFNYIISVAHVDHSTFTISFDFEGHVVEMAIIDNRVMEIRVDALNSMMSEQRYRDIPRYR